MFIFFKPVLQLQLFIGSKMNLMDLPTDLNNKLSSFYDGDNHQLISCSLIFLKCTLPWLFCRNNQASATITTDTLATVSTEKSLYLGHHVHWQEPVLCLPTRACTLATDKNWSHSVNRQKLGETKERKVTVCLDSNWGISISPMPVLDDCWSPEKIHSFIFLQALFLILLIYKI